jgi:periplasmic protein TonB
MTRTEFHYASPNAHLLIGEMPAPRQMDGRWWEGTGLSIAAHAVALGVLLYAATHVTQVAQTVVQVSGPLTVFLDRPGPGGGRGSEGTTPRTPPRPPQILAAMPLQLTPVANPVDPPPLPQITIPAVTSQANQALPGDPTALDPTSLGRGSGPGAGEGPGTGNGPGAGDGRPGVGAGETVGPGMGVISPQLIKEVKPLYTVDAMRAKLQGVVALQAVVLPDGSVDPARIRITRSLDAIFGLDQQAILAVKQWRFRPGTRRGEPVAMWVDVELTFTLR